MLSYVVSTINGTMTFADFSNVHLPSESRLALDMFKSYMSESYQKNGFYSAIDFIRLAKFYKTHTDSAKRYILQFAKKKDIVRDSIEKSFMSREGKERYRDLFFDMLKTINI